MNIYSVNILSAVILVHLCDIPLSDGTDRGEHRWFRRKAKYTRGGKGGARLERCYQIVEQAQIIRKHRL